MSLEELLGNMQIYGKPSLSMQDGATWYCRVNVFVCGAGVDFQIASDFGHKNAFSAASQCNDRMVSAMNNLSTKHNLIK